MTDEPERRGPSTRAVVWPAVALLAAAFLAWVTPNFQAHHDHHDWNDWRAVGQLKTLQVAQNLFRENDKERDDLLDYGTLQELSNASIVDPVLGSGTKEGYVFQVRPSPTTGEFLWFAVANPTAPGTTGHRSFCTNHDGIIYYTTAGPLSLEDGGVECEIPPRVVPVER